MATAVTVFDLGEKNALITINEESLLTPQVDDKERAIAEQHNAGDAPDVWRLAIFTTVPLFMGYAGMIVLQGHIKERLGISNGANDASYVFGVGVSFLYLGNLIFRLMHNILFTCLRPRQRVLLAYSAMAVAHTLLAVMYYIVKSKSVAWVFVSYAIAGVAIGTFESNLISCLTPLGHRTKMWAVIGIPVGFNFMSIGSFVMFTFEDNLGLQLAVYLFIAAANVCGFLFYLFLVPNIEFEASKDTVKVFFQDIVKFRHWIPLIWKHCFALAADMFSVTLFSSIVLFIFDVDAIPLWWNSHQTIPKHAFQAWFYTFSFLGDFSARRIAYYDRARNPFWYTILTCAGAAMILSKVALLAPFGMFCVMFGNGSIYAQSTKFVDNVVPKKYNLAALSIWLFVGDIGSFIGAQLVQTLRGAIGDVPHMYQTTAAPFTNWTLAPNATVAPGKAFMELLFAN